MANRDDNKKVGLLKNLTFAAEARADGGVTSPIEGGRFRYFISTFKKRNGSLMLANLLFVVTLLPLLAVLVIVSIFGVENLSYKLANVVGLPYFLSGVGFGISSASSVLVAKLAMLDVYSLIFLAVGVSMLFMSIGLSGMMPIAMKFIREDEYEYKKDSYGNKVPKVLVEFFRGIKKYWWQMLLVGIMLMVVIAGVGNAYTFFLAKLWQGIAGAGEWILVIFLSAFTILFLMFVVYLIPMIVAYDIPYIQKMKNAIILTMQMFLQNLFIVILLAVPFVIIAVSSGIINILLIALIIVYGAPVYCLIMSNVMQYYTEKIFNPVYLAKYAKGNKPKKKGKK